MHKRRDLMEKDVHRLNNIFEAEDSTSGSSQQHPMVIVIPPLTRRIKSNMEIREGGGK